MNAGIQQRLEKIISRYIPEEAKAITITDDTNFLSDLKINSANLIDIMLDVEDEFDITISNDEMDKMTTVGSAKQMVDSKLTV
ncbi:MAG: phosphopantetheine-binding protein [Chitinophagaceae bacterium]